LLRIRSVSMVSAYGLDDRVIEVRSPAEAKGIFPLSSVSRPALRPTQPPVQWVPGVLSLGVKRCRGLMVTTHPHLVLRSRVSRSYTSSPPKRLRGVLWDCFSFNRPYMDAYTRYECVLFTHHFTCWSEFAVYLRATDFWLITNVELGSLVD
jgi:hypothetical protein